MSMRDDELNYLIKDYELARADENQQDLIQAAILGVLAASFLSVMAMVKSASESSWQSSFGVWLYCIAPIVLLFPVVMAQWVSSRTILRSFYMRNLEREIRDRRPVKQNLENESVSSLTVFSFIELFVSHSSMAGRQLTRGLIFMWVIVLSYIAAYVSLLYVCVEGLIRNGIPLLWVVLFGLIYVMAGIGLAVDVWYVNVNGRHFYRKVCEVLSIRMRGSVDSVESSAVQKYSAFIPRKDDLSKSAFGFIGISAYFQTFDTLPRLSFNGLIVSFVIYVLAFEVLLYQTRYIVNDLLGVSPDSEDPHSGIRGRIPATVTSVRRVVRLLLLRILLICLVGGILAYKDAAFAAWYISSLISIVFFGVVYEYFRSVRWDSGSSVPFRSILIVFLVPSGYALRVMAGYYLAAIVSAAYVDATFVYHEFSNLSTPLVPISVSMLILMAYASGLVFVSLNWLVEVLGSAHMSEGSFCVNLKKVSSKPHLFFILVTFLWTLNGVGHKAVVISSASDAGSSTFTMYCPSEVAKSSFSSCGAKRQRVFSYGGVLVRTIVTPWGVGLLLSCLAFVFFLNSLRLLDLSSILYAFSSSIFLFFSLLLLWIVQLFSSARAVLLSAVVFVVSAYFVPVVTLSSVSFFTLYVSLLFIFLTVPWLSFARRKYDDLRDVLRKFFSYALGLYPVIEDKVVGFLLHTSCSTQKPSSSVKER